MNTSTPLSSAFLLGAIALAISGITAAAVVLIALAIVIEAVAFYEAGRGGGR